MKNNKERLQKYLASCGIASRRKSELIIKSGKIKVNGTVIREMGFKVGELDIIELENRIIRPEKKKYVILNKPPDILCTHKDNWKRKTVYDIIEPRDTKLFSVGRLDSASCGLIILTNDGDFAHKVIHPSNNVVKEYYVESVLKPSKRLIEGFKKGVTIKGVKYKAENIKHGPNDRTLFIYLKEGRKREIRVVYDHYKGNIKTLRRNAIGLLRLDKLDLKEGEYMFLTLNEIDNMVFGPKI